MHNRRSTAGTLAPLRSTASLALMLTVLACGGSGDGSPTAPIMPGAGLTITFADSQGLLSAREEKIRALIESAYMAASQRIFIDDVEVIVFPGPHRVVPGWTVGGFAGGPRIVEIGIDAAQPDHLLEERLPSIVAHELHHVARIRGPGYGATLLEAMASEGLADHFAEELLGEELPPWTTALSESERDFWIERARPELDSTSYHHPSWFFGDGQMPNWTGYTIGFYLVSVYQSNNGNPSAAQLVDADAELFRP